MESFSLHLGPFVVKVNRNCLVLCPKGSDGRHLTLYFEQNRGRKWTPHLTLPRLSRRIPLGSWSTRAGQELTEAVSDAWGRAWLAALRPADMRALDAEGWVAIQTTEKDALRWLDTHLKVGPRTYRLHGESLKDLWPLVEGGARCLLDLTPGDGSWPVSILRCSDAGAVDHRFLAFLPEGSWGDAVWRQPTQQGVMPSARTSRAPLPSRSG
ncbi:MAG: hypothetical protein EOP84_05085 [Verrucomicrobiaceae bacterium]|nr:MAG: hypothetical protein EOP84_05085 [Verrucomicrobiaceae bacterium]